MFPNEQRFDVALRCGKHFPAAPLHGWHSHASSTISGPTPCLVTRSRDLEEAEEEPAVGQGRGREKKAPVQGLMGQGSAGRRGSF